MTVHFAQCLICNAVYFPTRLVCRGCQGKEFRSVPVHTGTVKGTTTTPQGIVIVDAVAAGINVVASCSAPPEPGAQLALYTGVFDRRRRRQLFVPGATHTQAEGEE